MKPTESVEHLNQWLNDLLPGARLQAQTLPDCPQISLYLLNPDYPQQQLSACQQKKILDEPMYWVFCWASGQVLAQHILQNPQLVKDKQVLDFGCGSGVVAIACAMAGAAQVFAADLDPLAREATRANLALNGVHAKVVGDWNELENPVDVITVADVLYDRSNLPLLSEFVQRATMVMVADSRIRDFNYPPYQRIGSFGSSTWPDLDEANEFRQVSLYYAGRSTV